MRRRDHNSIDILFDAGSDAEKKKRKYKEVRRADSEIDHKERELEALCMKILLRQQPVASDLRIVSSVLKMISILNGSAIRLPTSRSWLSIS